MTEQTSERLFGFMVCCLSCFVDEVMLLIDCWLFNLLEHSLNTIFHLEGVLNSASFVSLYFFPHFSLTTLGVPVEVREEQKTRARKNWQKNRLAHFADAAEHDAVVRQSAFRPRM